MLKSKILASSFYQLGVEFDKCPEELKKQKKLETQLCGDLSVMRQYHANASFREDQAKRNIVKEMIERDLRDYPMRGVNYNQMIDYEKLKSVKVTPEEE